MNTVIISLGGSLIVPQEVDYTFLKKFHKVILSFPQSRFIIFCGGGALARRYQQLLKEVAHPPQETLDWIGIQATRINARRVQELFGVQAEEHIITDPTKKIISKKRIIIGAGWKPGWSTDFDAVLVAKQLKATSLINMSNIEYVYDKDPRKHKDARAMKELSWKQLRSIVGSTWSPGLNMPFDPIAAKEAERVGLEVAIIGKNLSNLSSLLHHKPFKGTTIRG